MTMEVGILWLFIVGISISVPRFLVLATQNDRVYHGRYTRDVKEPELLIPRHVHKDGKFRSFALPNYYSREEIIKRRKRSSGVVDADKLHLILPFNTKDHHVELTPYHDFISPEMVIETRGYGNDLNERLRFERAADDQCYYRGHIRGHRRSRAALALCEGVAGVVETNDGKYFIEPIEHSRPGTHGQHLHMIYKRKISHDNHTTHSSCGAGDNWESAWVEQLERVRRLNTNSSISGLKRFNENNTLSATHSLHRFVEIAVVADKKFLEFWAGRDYQRYLLTIMNMVADYYHDSSTGNQIDVVVVRMIYLQAPEKEVDLSITHSADDTLVSFSSWANKINPKDSSHPLHHDVSLLISRHDLCSIEEGCGLLGLAHIASACDPKKASAITEDNGLLLGITAAHELGHVLGCSHDEVKISGCDNIDASDGSTYIMSPNVHMYTMRWSPCSRKFITNFLSSGLGECLNDDPKDPPDKYTYPLMLPGAMYDADFQCSLQMVNSFACQLEGEWECRKLWCSVGDNQCFTLDGPPAEGTSCGVNKWCIKKQCVERGVRPAAVHGGWGEWSTPTECSRTCGGGIRSAERECDNPQPANGGRYCIGERRKITICNTEACDPKEPSYRAMQCAEFNSRTIMGDNHPHKWAPYLPHGLDPCKLFCLNEENTYVEMGQARDATPCKGGTKYMCLSGVCRVVGCDWEMDSSAIEDQCGTCKGDGTKCDMVEGLYTLQGPLGYAKVVTIPKGARSIEFTELYSTQNVLAVKYQHNNSYCLNGNYFLDNDGEFDCAGSRLLYKHPHLHKEEIIIKGPITEDIELQYVFLDGKNDGVRYKYYVEKTGPFDYTPKYLWEFTHWSECDAQCGGGSMIAQPTCIEQQNGIVSDNFCSTIPRPAPKTRICNEDPCLAKWRVSQWSQCSACKGASGSKTRKVQCVRPAPHIDGEDIQVELSACTGTPPKQVAPCEGTRPCNDPCVAKQSKNSQKRQGTNNASLIDTENIDNLINMGLAQYLDKADDETLDTDKEFKSLLHELLQKEKRTHINTTGAVLPVTTETNVIAIDLTLNITGSITDSPNKDVRAVETTSNSTLQLTKNLTDLSLKSIRDTDTISIQTVAPGSIIRDYEALDQAVLVEAPLKDDSFKANLSDLAFQELGDSVPIRLDIKNQKIHRGPEARVLINEMEYGNTTNRSYDDNLVTNGTVV